MLVGTRPRHQLRSADPDSPPYMDGIQSAVPKGRRRHYVSPVPDPAPGLLWAAILRVAADMVSGRYTRKVKMAT